MTTLMRRLRTAVKSERPTLVTVATSRTREAYDDRLQDWSTWLQEGRRRGVPMASPRMPRGREQIASARAANGRAIWAGIGAYPVAVADGEQHRTARRLGAAGVILFSCDLADPRLGRPRLPGPGCQSRLPRTGREPGFQIEGPR